MDWGKRLEGRLECGRFIDVVKDGFYIAKLRLHCPVCSSRREEQRSRPYAMRRVERTKAPSHDAMTGREIGSLDSCNGIPSLKLVWGMTDTWRLQADENLCSSDLAGPGHGERDLLSREFLELPESRAARRSPYTDLMNQRGRRGLYSLV